MKIGRSRFQARRERLQVQVNLPSGPTPLEDVGDNVPRPRKKALLIGVQYASNKQQALKGPHRDVAAMKQLIIDKYDYAEKDIVTLIDSKDPRQIQPTHDNMIDAMKNLVHGATVGDRFFFHYSGHATQVKNKDNKEEDGMDECIIPCDSTGSTDDPKLIKDDLLRKILVDSLPKGTHLVAIFDSCHSASMLDLKHFRCNRVYVPWVSKGRRKSDSMWMDNVRKNAALVNTRTVHQTSRLSNDSVKIRKTSFDRMYDPTTADHIPSTPESHLDGLIPSSRPATPRTGRSPTKQKEYTTPRHRSQSITRRRRRQSTKTAKSSYTPWFEDQLLTDEPLYDSPVEEFCSGRCRNSRESPCLSRMSTFDNGKSPVAPFRIPAEVISLGSCKDSQIAWEDLEGSSMTQSLVDILGTDPHPTLKDVMTRLSHAMHDKLVKMHTANKDFKRKRKMWRIKKRRKPSPEGDTKGLELNNFQDPQLSSDKPLDMDSRFNI